MNESDAALRVSDQIFKKLLQDLYEAIRKTEEDARKKGKVFSEADRYEILFGFVLGASRAAADVQSKMGTYLQWMVLSGCSGAKVRPIMEEGDEQFHQLMHRLSDMFPSGKLPKAVLLDAGSQEDLARVLKDLRNAPPPPAPEDMN